MKQAALRAVNAWVERSRVFMVQLSDGSLLAVRPESSKLLARATRRQIARFQILNDGEGFIWPELGETLSVRGFVQQSQSEPCLVQICTV